MDNVKVVKSNPISLKNKIFSKDFFEKIVVLLVLIVLVIVFSSMSEYFLSLNNFFSIGMTVSVIGLIAIGQTMCIICLGFDMSVGMVAALGGVLFAKVVTAGVPVPIAVLIGLAFGCTAGLINGLCIAKLKLNAFITTFVWLQIYRGIIFIITEGMPITITKNKAFTFLGTYKVFGVIPLPIVILLALYIIFYLILKYTRFGRQVYCVGGNPEAARICGISVDKIQILSYVLISALSALGGILFASRVSAAQPFIGETYALDTIAAAVLGGTSMAGGKGNVLGSLLGVIIIGVVQNGLIMINMPSYYQYLATGIIMFFAVLLHLDK